MKQGSGYLPISLTFVRNLGVPLLRPLHGDLKGIDLAPHLPDILLQLVDLPVELESLLHLHLLLFQVIDSLLELGVDLGVGRLPLLCGINGYREAIETSKAWSHVSKLMCGYCTTSVSAIVVEPNRPNPKFTINPSPHPTRTKTKS